MCNRGVHERERLPRQEVRQADGILNFDLSVI